MKRIIYLPILFLSVLSISVSGRSDYDELYRNQYHFSVPQNKMGAPLSVVFANGQYHLFYQHNPFNLMEGYFHTGYAVSDDFISWKHQGLVLKQPENATDSMDLSPWWGTIASHVNDQMAWMNLWNKGIMRYSADENFEFSKKEQTTGTEKLRRCEPYVFWYNKDEKWVMVAYNRPEGTMYILNSANGTDWTETSSFEYAYGFPQFVEMEIGHNPDVTRWVLVSEGGKYVTGDFDGEHFDFDGEPKIFNHGKNIGGSVVFRRNGTGEYLLMSELKSEQLADLPSNGNFTFPAVVELLNINDAYTLVLNPVEGIETLWGKNYAWENEKVYPGLGQNVFRRVKGNELHIKGSIRNINSNIFSFILRTDKGERGFEIGFDVKRKLLNVFDSQLPFEMKNDEVEVEILIDRSVVEIFIDNGRFVFSKTFSPIPEMDRYVLNTSGGEIILRKLQIHRVKSAW
jgi:sucrose-6-phosphate hydrolase SacC (GH32 family)